MDYQETADGVIEENVFGVVISSPSPPSLCSETFPGKGNITEPFQYDYYAVDTRRPHGSGGCGRLAEEELWSLSPRGHFRGQRFNQTVPQRTRNPSMEASHVMQRNGGRPAVTDAT